MIPRLVPLGFDPTGKSRENLVRDERHSIPAAVEGHKRRAVILEKGCFYNESLAVRDPSGRTLVRGVDYVTYHHHAKLSARLAHDINMAIIIINEKVIDAVYIDAQMVGGEFCFVGPLISESIYDLGHRDEGLNWYNITDKPATYPVVRHNHALYQTYGWEPFYKEIKRIHEALVQINQNELDQAIKDIQKLTGDYGQLIEDMKTRIDGHINDTNNPHQDSLENLGLGVYEDATFLSGDDVTKGDYDGDEFITGGGVVALVNKMVLNDLNDHVKNTNNPHHVTLDQLDTYSSRDIKRKARGKYEVGEVVNDSEKIDGMDYDTLVDYIRGNADAGRITGGVIDPERIGEGYNSDEYQYLAGDGTWKSVEEYFHENLPQPDKIRYVGTLGDAKDDEAFNTLKDWYGDENDYPVGTILLYGENYLAYEYTYSDFWKTTGVLLQFAVRTDDGWQKMNSDSHTDWHWITDPLHHVNYTVS